MITAPSLEAFRGGARADPEGSTPCWLASACYCTSIAHRINWLWSVVVGAQMLQRSVCVRVFLHVHSRACPCTRAAMRAFVCIWV